MQPYARSEPFPGLLGIAVNAFIGPLPEVPTGWIVPPGRYTAHCSHAGGASYLAVKASDGARDFEPSPDAGLGLAPRRRQPRLGQSGRDRGPAGDGLPGAPLKMNNRYYAAFALPLAVMAAHPFQYSIRPLSPQVRSELRHNGFWQPGCPVGLSDLRVLAVTHYGWDGHAHTGRLIVNRKAAAPLARVFRKLYGLHFPIRHMRLADVYGPKSGQPRDGDVSGSFECRQAVPSPCVGGSGTGNWSNHAYGLAVDINPTENPYVGCGATRDKASRRSATARGTARAWSHARRSRRSRRSAGAGAARGPATPRTTCTSRSTATSA